MAQKSSTDPLPSSRALKLVGKMYRWVAWIGVVATLFFTVLLSVVQWRDMHRYYIAPHLSDLVINVLLVAGLTFMAGTFLSGMAFMVSLLIEAGLRMLENSHTQVDLMRHLVRQQSDITSATRLGEKDVAAQINLDKQAIEEQIIRRTRSG